MTDMTQDYFASLHKEASPKYPLLPNDDVVNELTKEIRKRINGRDYSSGTNELVASMENQDLPGVAAGSAYSFKALYDIAIEYGFSVDSLLSHLMENLHYGRDPEFEVFVLSEINKKKPVDPTDDSVDHGGFEDR